MGNKNTVRHKRKAASNNNPDCPERLSPPRCRFRGRCPQLLHIDILSPMERLMKILLRRSNVDIPVIELFCCHFQNSVAVLSMGGNSRLLSVALSFYSDSARYELETEKQSDIRFFPCIHW